MLKMSVFVNRSVLVSLFSLALFHTSMAVAASKAPTVIPMQDRGANTYYIQAVIGGHGASDFMVDTGSGYTVINEDTLQELKKTGNATYVKELRGILADGTLKRVPVYRITSLTLGNGCEIADVEAAVFPGSTRHILGISTLRHTGSFEFSFTPPQLILKHCGNT